MDHVYQQKTYGTKMVKIPYFESLLPFPEWGTGNASLSLFSPLFLINFTITLKKILYLEYFYRSYGT
jgi:hypothetical protein